MTIGRRPHGFISGRARVHFLGGGGGVVHVGPRWDVGYDRFPLIKRSGGPMRRWAFVAVVIAGCGGNQPFEPGDRATLVNPGNNKVLVVNTTEGPQAVQTVAAGTRVAIVNDPGPPGVAGRMIRVELLDPPFQGLQGDVPRDRLRPE
jgi:hypothetical protein